MKKQYKRRFVEDDFLLEGDTNLRICTAELIFEEIDKVIRKSIRKKPVRLEDSNFLKEYEKIKKKWLIIGGKNVCNK